MYNSVSEVEDCDLLQVDLDTIYKWADANNMTFNSNKFKYVCYTPSDTSAHGNVYLCPKMNLIDKVNDNKDLGITMLVFVLGSSRARLSTSSIIEAGVVYSSIIKQYHTNMVNCFIFHFRICILLSI